MQPALQHVLELSAIAMVFGHLGVAAARDHLHSHSPYMSSATLTMEKLRYNMSSATLTMEKLVRYTYCTCTCTHS